jgi:DNA-binding transcriptional ArsR family regulator
MEISYVSRAFDSLAHETRLAIVRMLVPAGAEGLKAGTISDRLSLRPSAVSFHLNRLRQAGLVRRRRSGRELHYAADYERLSDLLAFLVDDCCAAAPEGCMPGCPSFSMRPPKVPKREGR